MIIVHHLNNSRSQRLLWLLEELGLEYRIEAYQRDPETMLAPPSLRKIHPLGKSPVLEDGEQIVAESGAIIEYLIDRYGGGLLRPADGTPERLKYCYWLHYAEGSLMSPLLLRLVFDRVQTAPVPFFVKPIVKAIVAKVRGSFIDPQAKAHLDFVESELGKQPWFGGEEFSAADVQMSFPLEAAMLRVSGTDRPNIKSFLERIHQRPAYQRALERGGPYDYVN